MQIKREVIVFEIEEEKNRVTIYEDAQGFITENNEIDNITAMTTFPEDNEIKEAEQEKYRKIVQINEDIENMTSKAIDFMSTNYRQIKPKQFSIQDNHFFTLIELQNYQGDSDSIWVAKFSSDEKYLATGGKSGVLKIWEVMSYEDSIDLYEHNCIKEFLNFFNEIAFRIYSEHKKDIIDLAWSEINKNTLVTVSIDHTAILWDINSESSIRSYYHNSIVSCVVFYPNVPITICGVNNEDDVFITGCLDKIVRIWGKNNNDPIIIINVAELVTSITFFPEANHIIMGSSQGKLLIYECVVCLFKLMHILL